MAEIRLTAQVLKQKAHELYLFRMNSADLSRLCYVTPRSEDDPEEIQRILKPERAKAIGKYIQEETSLLPNAIVVNLTAEVKVENTSQPDQRLIVFPSTQGKFAYILDGQHRLAGFQHSEAIQFDLPVVALHNAPTDLRGKVFADINSKQIKVTDVHTLSLYYQIKELPRDEATTMDVVWQLAKGDEDSPLYDRVRMKDDDKGTWITNKHLKKCIAPHTESGGVLAGKTPAQQGTILKEFLKGVRATWPDAWSDTKSHMLGRSMGTEAMFGIFAAAKHRCDLNSGRQYTEATFAAALEPLQGCSIDIPGGGSVALDWRRGKEGIGMLSNAPGKLLIRKQLLDILQQADE